MYCLPHRNVSSMWARSLPSSLIPAQRRWQVLNKYLIISTTSFKDLIPSDNYSPMPKVSPILSSRDTPPDLDTSNLFGYLQHPQTLRASQEPHLKLLAPKPLGKKTHSFRLAHSLEATKMNESSHLLGSPVSPASGREQVSATYE